MRLFELASQKHVKTSGLERAFTLEFVKHCGGRRQIPVCSSADRGRRRTDPVGSHHSAGLRDTVRPYGGIHSLA